MKRLQSYLREMAGETFEVSQDTLNFLLIVMRELIYPSPKVANHAYEMWKCRKITDQELIKNLDRVMGKMVELENLYSIFGASPGNCCYLIK